MRIIWDYEQDQHNLPKFLLRNMKSNKLYCWRKYDNDFKHVSVDNTACVINQWDHDIENDNQYMGMDGTVCNNVLRKIKDKFVFNIEDKELLAKWMGLLMLRSRDVSKAWQEGEQLSKDINVNVDFIKSNKSSIIAEYYSYHPQEAEYLLKNFGEDFIINMFCVELNSKKDQLGFKAKDKYSQHIRSNIHLFFAKCLMEKHWHVLKSSCDFIIGDNPILRRCGKIYKCGITPAEEVILPISKHYAIYLTQQKQQSFVINASNKFVKKVNILSYHSATDYLWGEQIALQKTLTTLMKHSGIVQR